jgi:CHAT domain-containing protein/tetratricopeptide (TPR) repeat protein
VPSSDPQESAKAKQWSDQGKAYKAAGRHEDALNCFKQAVAAFGKAHAQEAAAQAGGDAGMAAYMLGNFAEATAFWQPVLEFAVASKTWQMEAQACSNLAAAEGYLGHIDPMFALIERALAIYRGHQDRLKEAECLGNRGTARYERGDWTGAEQDWSQCLALYRAAGATEQDQMEYLQGLGLLYCDLGEVDRGHPLLEQALAAARKVQDPYVEAAVLNTLGTMYYFLNDMAKAIEYAQQALAIQNRRADKSGQATCHNNLAAYYKKQDRLAEARTEYEKALALSRAAGKKPTMAAALANLGRVRALEGFPSEARAQLEASLALRRELSDRYGEAMCLATLGELDLDDCQPKRALDQFMEALWIQAGIGDRHQQIRSMGLVMKAQGLLGRTPLAILFGKEAMRKIQERRAGMRGVPSELQRGFVTTYEPILRILADLLMEAGRTAEAHVVIKRMKEEEYLGFARQPSGPGALDPALDLNPWEQAQAEPFRRALEPAAGLSAQLAALRQRAPAGLSPAEQARQTTLEGDLRRARIAFEALMAGSAFAPTPAFDPTAGGRQGNLQDLPEALDKRVATLHFVVTERHVGTLLTQAGRQWVSRQAIPDQELTRKVLAFRRCLQDPGKDPLPLAKELYRILIGPVERRLRQTRPRTLRVSLDGVLRYLPMAALHDGRKYLAESYGLVVLTEAARFGPSKHPRETWRFKGLGVTQPFGELPGLPGVAQELGAILRQGQSGFLAGTIALDGAFTAKTLAQSAQAGYTVLHLATHFKLVPGTEDHSFLLLGDGSHLSLKQFREQAPDLRTVDLLTLSACDTALGAGRDQDGKEVEGIATLALRCGAHSVLASLWPVVDRNVSPVLLRFYQLRGERGRMAKAEALRQAQTALIGGTGLARHYRHPCYWANFVLMGDYE